MDERSGRQGGRPPAGRVPPEARAPPGARAPPEAGRPGRGGPGKAGRRVAEAHRPPHRPGIAREQVPHGREVSVPGPAGARDHQLRAANTPPVTDVRPPALGTVPPGTRNAQGARSQNATDARERGPVPADPAGPTAPTGPTALEEPNGPSGRAVHLARRHPIRATRSAGRAGGVWPAEGPARFVPAVETTDRTPTHPRDADARSDGPRSSSPSAGSGATGCPRADRRETARSSGRRPAA